MIKASDLLLEFFERVKRLEERVVELETEITDLKVVESSTPASTKISSQSRLQVLSWLASEIMDKNPGLTVRKASRSEGGGLIVEKEDKSKSLHVKVAISKSHQEWPASWHTITADELNGNWDLFVFVITTDPRHTFWFNQAELKALASIKKPDPQGFLHFYFHVVNPDQALEIRDGKRDVTGFWNRVQLPSRLL